MAIFDIVCEHCGIARRVYRVAGQDVPRFCSRKCYFAVHTNTAEDAWNHVDRSGGPDACWPWQLTPADDGYGQFAVAGTHWIAHRLVYVLVNGPIPDDVFVCHSCDNRRCCNPTHLFPGTAADNSADMASKGRAARGERHPNARLTEAAVREIVERRARGENPKAIAARFGVHFSTVYRVLNGTHWWHTTNSDQAA